MKVLLLGATGRLGRCILEELTRKGFEVNILVRSSERLSPGENVKVYAGNTCNAEHLKEALQGCEAVLSALNISRKSDFPWAELRTPPTFLSDTLTTLLPLMRDESAKRIIITSALGVGDSAPEIPGWFQWLIKNSNIRYAYEDHQRQEELLMKSDSDWTIIRPAGLTNSRRIKNLVISRKGIPKPSLTISRTHVARFMVSVLRDRSHIREKIAVSER